MRVGMVTGLAFCAVLAGLATAPSARAFGPVAGSPFISGQNFNTLSIAFSPAGRLLAITKLDNPVVEVFSVNAQTGALAELSSTAVGTDPASVAFSPDGTLLAVDNEGSDSISLFAVKQSTGTLTAEPHSPYSAPNTPTSLAFSPDGKWLAVTDQGNTNDPGLLDIFEVYADQQLIFNDAEETGRDPVSVAFNPDGNLVAVANQDSQNLTEMSLDDTAGVLGPIAGSPFALPFTDPDSLAFSPVGGPLAVVGGASSVAMFSVNQTKGKLTALPGSPFATGKEAVSVAFSPDGSLLASANATGNSMSVFSVDPQGGQPTQISGSPFSVDSPIAIAFSPGGGLVATANRGLVVNSSGPFETISVFSTAPPPTVSITTPADGFTYSQNEVVDADYSCADSASGPGLLTSGGCTGTVADGAPLDTSATGVHSFTVTATSQDGQSTSETVHYDVPASHQVEVSEFRLIGPTSSMGDNEYVDLYNNTGATLDVSGWSLVYGTDRSREQTISLPAVTVPTDGHLLVASSGYSLGAVAEPDVTGLAASPDQGVKVLGPGDVVSDAVGMAGSPSDLHAGTPVPLPAAYPSGEFSWVRQFSAGAPVDTDDNASDFAFVAVDDNDVAHGSPQLGVPSPQDLASPVVHNDILQSSLVDPSVAQSASPNLIYTPGNPAASPGTLVINRTLTNCSGQPRTGACVNAAPGTAPQTVTRLRFRITGLTTLGSPGAGTRQAVLESQSSMTATFDGVTVRGLTLQPSPAQLDGGGLNSTLDATADLPTGGLVPGQSINVEFQFAVPQTGTFSFAYNAEDDLEPDTALTSDAPRTLPAAQSSVIAAVAGTVAANAPPTVTTPPSSTPAASGAVKTTQKKVKPRKKSTKSEKKSKRKAKKSTRRADAKKGTSQRAEGEAKPRRRSKHDWRSANTHG